MHNLTNEPLIEKRQKEFFDLSYEEGIKKNFN